MKKIRLAVLFGGRSAEHEVSVRSAKTIIDAVDHTKYDVVPMAIDKGGAYLSEEASRQVLVSGAAASDASQTGRTVMPDLAGIDVVFPVLHGTYGEDGAMQGLLKLANVPFVGAGVLGSAIGMDKDVMKRLLKEAKIPVARWLTVEKSAALPTYAEVVRALGKTVFVKPANLGSSIGISKAATEAEYTEALRLAFRYDTKVLIEACIVGREIECAVLGNEAPKASLPGEIVVNHAFYSYDAKYIDEHGAHMAIPAQISEQAITMVQDMAVKAFKVLCCQGMGRVDFFLQPDGTVLLNEINTIPGFTSASMYPKLWEASGLPLSELIDQLVELARKRFREESELATSLDAVQA